MRNEQDKLDNKEKLLNKIWKKLNPTRPQKIGRIVWGVISISGITILGLWPYIINILPIYPSVHTLPGAFTCINLNTEVTHNTMTEYLSELIKPQLTANEIDLLKNIIQLETEDKNLIAQTLYDNFILLSKIGESGGDNPIYFSNENKLSTPLNGYGTAFKLPNRIYYGEFKNGVPDGKNIAIALDLDFLTEGEFAYEYIDGHWSGGFIDGFAEYGDIQEGGLSQDIYTGNFIKDKINGTVTCISYDNSDIDTYNLTYYKNVLDLSDWTYAPTRMGDYYKESDTKCKWYKDSTKPTNLRFYNGATWYEE